MKRMKKQFAMEAPLQSMPRRHFLRNAALAGLAITSTRSTLLASDKEDANWQPRQCLSSAMFSSLTLEGFCAKAEALGFEGIDLWAPFGKCEHMEQARRMGARDFLKLLKKHRLEVGAWTVYKSNQHMGLYGEYADFIANCGGGVVVFGTTFANEAKTNIKKTLAAYLDKMEPQIKRAQQDNVFFAVENHSSSIFNKPESFEIFHESNPDPEVIGIALAPYHLQKIKVGIVDAIRACRGQIKFFYAWQQAKGADQLPGNGPTDLKPWLIALKEEKYDKWMTPFMHGELSVDRMSGLVRAARQHIESLEI